MTRTGKSWALLIGVDCYMQNSLPGNLYYPSLGGCVRDIAMVESFLRARLGLKDENIIKLTASNPGGFPCDSDPERQPLEPPDAWPTYANMVAGFQRLIEQAEAGDQVYVHYSGHGGRASTVYPKLKGERGFDEVLVPTDIGTSEASYLRDLEIGHLLEQLVTKRVYLTIVLDSCHSGDATRGNAGAVRRGIAGPDTSVRPSTSLVAAPELLEAAQLSKSGRTRDLKPASGWLLEPEGYVLLAACRAQESAHEYPFDGHQPNGALTYWLLQSLEQLRPQLSYKMLHDRILAKIHSQFEQQTPQLQGDGSREVFGSDRVTPYFAVPVLDVDDDGERVLLNAGQAHFIRRGARFAIHPPEASAIRGASDPIANVEIIDEPGATECWAKIRDKTNDAVIEQGAQAVLIDPGTVKLQRPFVLTRREQLPESIDQDEAFARVRQALVDVGSAFAPLAEPGRAAAFQVVVNDQAEYEIWDPAGAPITNSAPALAITDASAPAKLVARLTHLAKYRNVQELDNYGSPLAGRLVVEFLGKMSDYNSADKPEPQPFDEPGSTPILRPGEWVFVRIANLLPPVAHQPTANVLNITVLDLVSTWAIQQIFPRSLGSYFFALDPGSDYVLRLRASLPDGCSQATDIIKVFATIGTTNFRWLELPALDQPAVRKAAASRGPHSPLDALLDALVDHEPQTRTLSAADCANEEWVTAQVEVVVRND